MSCTEEYQYFIGVDVGTGSTRAALVDEKGIVKKIAIKSINIWHPCPNFYQQSTTDIWNACCHVIKEVSENVNKESIKGLAFDATCSLVVLDKNGNPVSVSPQGEVEQNVILWMDHRAGLEASEINNSKHSLLNYVGGKISLEMELPKLLWLKKHLKEQCWNKAHYFFDLADFLSWRATGSDSRSLCTVECKWLYDATTGQWDKQFLTDVGLEDLLLEDCCKIGSVIKSPGTPCGTGLTISSARELGLLPGTCVSTSIIDAHAGALGLFGAKDCDSPLNLNSRLTLICGTSTCHMALSEDAVMVPGVWGPYYNALGMGLWLNEGGQSATGKLLDHIINIHPSTVSIKQKIPQNLHITEYLNKLLFDLSGMSSYDKLTFNVHVWPDYHGNRSPLADPTLRGMISGLSLSNDEKDLAVLYLATVQALAYGTKHIILSLQESGHEIIDNVLICGGLSKNKLFVQTHANVIGCRVLIPKEQESVLLGSAMLAATACGKFRSVQQAINDMACYADVVKPDNNILEYHEKKYKVFKRMVDNQLEYKRLMGDDF